MLGLLCATSDEWISGVLADPESVLIDHAHCEKKAATMAISLINRYPEKRELVEAMIGLAQEEMQHFSSVTKKIYERGYTLSRDPGDGYVQSLHKLIRPQEPHRLLDTLLVSSIIEARSCERFKLLSERAGDDDLKEFYRSLLESEAQHRSLFVQLARTYFGRHETDARLVTLNEEEQSLIIRLGGAPTMHG